jgi:hypothetical protein
MPKTAHPGPHTCQQCGAVFEGRKRTYCGSEECLRAVNAAKKRSERAAWTPERREYERRYQRQYYIDHPERADYRRPPNATCPVCGQPFIQSQYSDGRGWQMTCSRACGITWRFHMTHEERELATASNPHPYHHPPHTPPA